MILGDLSSFMIKHRHQLFHPHPYAVTLKSHKAQCGENGKVANGSLGVLSCNVDIAFKRVQID